MKYLPDSEAQQLIEEAKKASEYTYSPYSNFPVGAAVLTGDGTIIRGTNVENASYGLTICAERTALGHAVSTGKTNVKAIAVYCKTNAAAPCGACRQFIIEFGNDIVVVFMHGDEMVQQTIQELLPFAFTKETMAAVAGIGDKNSNP